MQPQHLLPLPRPHTQWHPRLLPANASGARRQPHPAAADRAEGGLVRAAGRSPGSPLPQEAAGAAGGTGHTVVGRPIHTHMMHIE